mmetsp:Transcript_2788/g.6539  ORF Transcript_2788/g.6539 Transcript_2788/m.6539 type:complete len:321 (-) Transcript_2788:455-1417(-)
MVLKEAPPTAVSQPSRGAAPLPARAAAPAAPAPGSAALNSGSGKMRASMRAGIAALAGATAARRWQPRRFGPSSGSPSAPGALFASTGTAPEISAGNVETLLQENPVVVISKSTCPFCAQAKETLEAEGVSFVAYEIDTLPAEETRAVQDGMQEMTGARTVPRVFFSGKCIGGCDDLLALQRSGKLSELVPAGSSSSGFKLQKSEDEWRQELDPIKYRILRQQGTEAPGSHEYDKWMPKAGYFACAGCGLPLYSADSKFRSNCGWPVFDKCYFSEDAGGCHVGTKPDYGSLEIICNRCDSHLGHVFFDAFSDSNPNGERH